MKGAVRQWTIRFEESLEKSIMAKRSKNRPKRRPQRLVGQALKKLGWKESNVTRLRKGDPKKIRIALRLRRETTMGLAWIVQRLHMGTKTHLAHLLYWHDRE